MRKIFDFHCHPFILERDRIGGYGVPADAAGFVSHLKKVGITACAGSVIHKTDGSSFDEVADMNNQALDFRCKYPDFYVPGVHIHPNFPEDSCRELERMKKAGVKLIGELVPYYMNWKTYSAPALMPVWDLAQELGFVVSVHPIENNDLDKLAGLFPKLKIVIAHPGEYNCYMERIEMMRRHDNLYQDICGTGLFRYGMLAYGVRQLGSQRFLFGTDFPTCSAGMQIGGVDTEDISDYDKDNIYYNNAKQLLEL